MSDAGVLKFISVRYVLLFYCPFVQLLFAGGKTGVVECTCFMPETVKMVMTFVVGFCNLRFTD